MNDFSKNVKEVTLVFLLCFVGLISYIAYFQVFKAPGIVGKAENPRIAAERDSVLRGTIYDSEGNVLAESTREESGKQVRKYPYGDLYGAVIGYSHPQYEQIGFEKSVDTELITTKKESPMETLTKKKSEEKPKVGNSVVSTLDTDLQKVARQALDDTGFNGSAVAMDPKTGDILAMVVTPTYDANDMDGLMQYVNSGESPDAYLFNKATQGLLPPGSIFKTMTMATALERNFRVSKKTFKDQGYIIVGDTSQMKNKKDRAEQQRLAEEGKIYVLHNFDSGFDKGVKDRGTVDLQLAFRYSSNVVFATLGIDVGSTILRESAEEYGFNEPIEGIGVKAIASQFPDNDVSEGAAAQSAIGQYQVRTTTLQMAMMVAAISNDGTLMTPKMIKEIKDSDGNIIKEVKPEVFRKDIMSKEVADECKKNMRAVVEPNENSAAYPAFAQFAGTKAGGKTGTADWNNADGTAAEPHGWFVSIAPYDNPEIVVAAVCEEGHSGAETAAAVAAKITNYYLNNKKQ